MLLHAKPEFLFLMQFTRALFVIITVLHTQNKHISDCVFYVFRCELAEQCACQPTGCEASCRDAWWSKNGEKAMAGILTTLQYAALFCGHFAENMLATDSQSYRQNQLVVIAMTILFAELLCFN